MQVYAGTSGYSYKEWKGAFYPEKLPAKGMLAYYAERLPTVEVNNTFYRLPKSDVVETWASSVPASFRFALKASMRITHRSRLKDVDESTAFMLRQFNVLGGRLGIILFQLHPNMKQDLPRLESFLTHLPEGTPAAFEFRHDSWFQGDTYATLRERDCALVVQDSEEATTPLERTAPRTYLRLRRERYSDTELEQWAQRVQELGGEEAFVFFKHEDEGTGPAAAARFLEHVR